MRYCLLLFFICLSTLALKAQVFMPGEVVMLDGEVHECEILFPIFNEAEIEFGKRKLFDKRYKYLIIDKGDGKEIQLEADDVDYFFVNFQDGQALWKRTKVEEYNLRGKVKERKFKTWLQYRKGCEEIQTYLDIYKWDINMDAELWESYIDGGGDYYIYKPGDKYPRFIGFVFLRKQMFHKGFDKQMAKLLKIYFDGDQHAQAFINDKKRISTAELSSYIESRCSE